MISVTSAFENKQTAAVREVECKVEVYSGSTLQATYTKNDSIISVEIQRTGDNSKLFGYYVSQRVNVHLRDLSRAISISSNQKLKVYFGFNNEFVSYPTFIITEVNRDEKNNELSITGYDQLYFLNKYNYGNLGLTGTKTIDNMVNAIAHLIKSSYNTAAKKNISGSAFSLSYDSAPFEYDIDLQTVLTQICEATQTVSYLDYTDKLTFLRVTNSMAPTGNIGKDRYFNLKTKENKKLTTIAYEGNQTASATTGATGTTQYIRDNNLLDSRSDLQTILTNAIGIVGGATIPQFEMEWRGKVQLEYGDNFAITLKDNSTKSCFVLDDTITFNGSLKEKTKFSFEKQESESEGETLTIAEAITVNKVGLEKAIEIATAEINGANGGYVTIIDADKDGNPDNIFITDLQITSDDIVLYNGNYVLSNDTNCTKVLRINKNGLGISSGTKAGTASNGYQTAVTGSGINASTITTGYLSADYIRAGTISSTDQNTLFDLDNSEIICKNSTMMTVLASGQYALFGWDQVNDDDYKRIGGLGQLDNSLCGNPYLFFDSTAADAVIIGYGRTSAYPITEFRMGGMYVKKPLRAEGGAYFENNSYFNYPAYFDSSMYIDGGAYIDSNIAQYVGNTFTQYVTPPSSGSDTIPLKSTLQGQSSAYWVGFGFGYGTEPKRPKISFVHAGYPGSLWMTSAGVLKWNGNNITTESSEKYKKDIEAATLNALSIINDSNIYKYKYKDDEDEYPVKYGLIIERECPQEIIDNSGDSINLYSMTTISWQAIKELTEEIKALKARVEELEKAGE